LIFEEFNEYRVGAVGKSGMIPSSGESRYKSEDNSIELSMRSAIS
jgi:hypothetical protein